MDYLLVCSFLLDATDKVIAYSLLLLVSLLLLCKSTPLDRLRLRVMAITHNNAIEIIFLILPCLIFSPHLFFYFVEIRKWSYGIIHLFLNYFYFFSSLSIF